MRSRWFVVVAAILVLLAGALWVSRGSRSTMAARNSEAPVTPSAPEPLSSSAPYTEPASSEPPTSAPAPSLPNNSAPRQTAALSVNGVPDVDPHVAFGSKTAPIIMEVFSDFQCPACKTLYTTTNRQLMDNYVTTGKVYLIHRDFPLPMHAHSRVAAQYSRAAAQIGKFEPVEQALFQNQEKWEQTGDVDGTVAAVLSSAEMTKVRALVKNGAPEAAIQKDLALGRTYNVNQTPTTVFHAKGQTFPYAGGMSYDILRGFLDQLAAQK